MVLKRRTVGRKRQLVERSAISVIVGLALLVMTAACSGPELTDSPQSGAEAEIRVGYPVTTLINGQIGQILERTNILELSGIDAEVFQFTHGPPTNEAMAAGEINVQFTSEAPGVSSIAQGIESLIAFSLGESRDAVLAARDSGIERPESLAGKTIAVPLGTTPYVHLLEFLEDNDLGGDVRIQDVAPEELAAALEQGSVDAVSYNEPLPTRLVQKTGARVIGEHDFFYVALMRRDFVEAQRETAARFLAAVARAVYYMSQNRSQVDAWFSEVSRTEVDVIREASLHTEAYASTEAIEDVDLGLTASDVTRLQGVADMLHAEGLIDSLPTIRDHVDLGLWEEAREILLEETFSWNDVRIDE